MIVVVKLWQRHFLFFEAITSFIISAIFTIWYYYYDGIKCISTILDLNRPAVYGTLASIFGSLLGFVITATSIVLGFSTSDKLNIVRKSSQYPKLWKIFSSTIRNLAIATLFSVICLLIDKDKSPIAFIVPLLFMVTILSLVRIIRTIWALEQIIFLVTKK